MANKEEFSYDQAIRELEGMVAKFEKAEIGVDELVQQVKRAGELIKACRGRLNTVEGEMKSAIAELQSAGEPEPQTAPAPKVQKSSTFSSDLEVPPADPAPFSALDDPFAEDIADAPFDSPNESAKAPKNPPKRSASKNDPPADAGGNLFSF